MDLNGYEKGALFKFYASVFTAFGGSCDFGVLVLDRFFKFDVRAESMNL